MAAPVSAPPDCPPLLLLPCQHFLFPRSHLWALLTGWQIMRWLRPTCSQEQFRDAASPAFARIVVGYSLLVILWGAFVRATGSGAGCGNHWPACDGQVLPRPRTVEMAIEFTHRATSGLTLLLVVALVVWAFRTFPRGHRVRGGALIALGFTLLEAALGAIQVKLGLVAGNTVAPAGRGRFASSDQHVFLIAGVVLTAWWAGGGAALRPRGQGAVGGRSPSGCFARCFWVSAARSRHWATRCFPLRVRPRRSATV
jgi:hypothetical protein